MSNSPDIVEGLTDAEISSWKQGGGGIALRGNTALTRSGVPIPIGKTPGAGTQVDIYLQTDKDAAYDNAVLGFYVDMEGHTVLYDTITLNAAEVANDSQIVKTTGGIAAEHWEVRLTLAGGLPAKSLRSAIIAYGVEDEQSNSFMISGSIQWSTTLIGPGATVTHGFNVPPLNKTGTYLVVAAARVVSSGVDPVGASMYSEAVFAWENVAGVVTQVPVISSTPETGADAALVGTTAATGAAGGQATVTLTLPGGLDASTHVQVTFSLTPLVVK